MLWVSPTWRMDAVCGPASTACTCRKGCVCPPDDRASGPDPSSGRSLNPNCKYRIRRPRDLFCSTTVLLIWALMEAWVPKAAAYPSCTVQDTELLVVALAGVSVALWWPSSWRRKAVLLADYLQKDFAFDFRFFGSSRDVSSGVVRSALPRGVSLDSEVRIPHCNPRVAVSNSPFAQALTPSSRVVGWTTHRGDNTLPSLCWPTGVRSSTDESALRLWAPSVRLGGGRKSMLPTFWLSATMSVLRIRHRWPLFWLSRLWPCSPLTISPLCRCDECVCARRLHACGNHRLALIIYWAGAFYAGNCCVTHRRSSSSFKCLFIVHRMHIFLSSRFIGRYMYRLSFAINSWYHAH